MANITLTLYWNLDDRRWTSDLLGTTEQGPITGLVQGDTVVLNVRFVQSGAAVTLTAPVFTASSIKASGDFTGSYLIQLSAPTGSPPLYVFTVNPLNSANLNTFLQTYRNTWAVLEIYDSANGILTTPLELQITPGYSLSGTPTDNAPGVVSVAAGKTVTFPQSLTFPSALGTNGFQLSTDGAGTLTWTASGALTDGDKGDITVSASGTTWKIDNDVVGLAQLAHMATARVVGRTTANTGSPELLTISGTGSVAMTTSPVFTTPSLGVATAKNIGLQFADGQDVITIAPRQAGTLDYILAITNAPLTVGQTATFPDVTGTVAVAATTTTATHALFGTTTAGAPAYRAIATADIATALTTPGAIGGTTPSTVAATTTSLKGVTSGVVTLAAPATATTATLTFAPSASVTMTPPATSFTAARTDAAQTFTGSATQTLTGSSQTVATVNTTNTASSSAGAATANLIVQNTSTQNFAHVSLGFRSCASAAPTIGYNGIISLDGAGRFNFGGDGGNSNSLSVTNVAGSGASGAGVTLTGGGNVTALGTLAITGASTLTGAVTTANFIAGVEMTAPSAPAANGYRIYAEDNGSGKTRLMVRFATGVAQQIAIEP